MIFESDCEIQRKMMSEKMENHINRNFFQDLFLSNIYVFLSRFMFCEICTPTISILKFEILTF